MRKKLIVTVYCHFPQSKVTLFFYRKAIFLGKQKVSLHRKGKGSLQKNSLFNKSELDIKMSIVREGGPKGV